MCRRPQMAIPSYTKKKKKEKSGKKKKQQENKMLNPKMQY